MFSGGPNAFQAISQLEADCLFFSAVEVIMKRLLDVDAAQGRG